MGQVTPQIPRRADELVLVKRRTIDLCRVCTCACMAL
jgi:hypothetical protein